jgi:hypothetical protein
MVMTTNQLLSRNRLVILAKTGPRLKKREKIAPQSNVPETEVAFIYQWKYKAKYVKHRTGA